MSRSRSTVTRSLAVATLALCVESSAGLAQLSTAYTACTPGALANCAVIELTSQLGIGPGGTNLFRIAVRNLGSQSVPTMATTIYNLVFGTGQSPVASGSEIDAAVAPVAIGGASVTDATEWDLFDSGEFIFLSALAGNGVGNCIPGAGVGGFSQSGNTCGNDSQFLTFDLFTPRAYDPSVFSLVDLEVVGLTNQLPADSCNDATPCVISAAPVTATPEPGTMTLTATALVGLIGVVRRRATMKDAGVGA